MIIDLTYYKWQIIEESVKFGTPERWRAQLVDTIAHTILCTSQTRKSIGGAMKDCLDQAMRAQDAICNELEKPIAAIEQLRKEYEKKEQLREKKEGS